MKNTEILQVFLSGKTILLISRNPRVVIRLKISIMGLKRTFYHPFILSYLSFHVIFKLLSLLIFFNKIDGNHKDTVWHLSKVLGNVKKNPYIINQNHILLTLDYLSKSLKWSCTYSHLSKVLGNVKKNHILSKNYCEVISG
jgi:hypothetical protein